MIIKENSKVTDKISSYPKSVQKQLLKLRQLIIRTAQKIESNEPLVETLKWGEPSYLTKQGSTIRIDWKATSPDQVSMYFHCRTKLVDTYKELYGDQLKFASNRAIVLPCNEKIPTQALKHCVELALTYHRIKHLPLLGT